MRGQAVLTRIDLRNCSGPLSELLPRPSFNHGGRLEAVRSIVAEVRDRGDAALIDFTRRFDGVELQRLTVGGSEVAAAVERVEKRSPEVHAAIATAVHNVEAYHRCQVPEDVLHESPGLTIRELHRPVRRAGCYAPGGRAVYPSTVIMTAVPARVAGVCEIVLAVPPGADGRVPDATLAAAAAAGVHEIHPVGGAQAIAALAHGTESIRPVDVIAGPGNVWVSLAQREVSDVVGVPSACAGPSEVIVVADGTAVPVLAAADLILQAEHGPDGLAWLVTWEPSIAAAVESEVLRLASAADRSTEIASTMRENGYCVLCSSPAQAFEVVNRVAPEHLELMTADPDALLPLVQNAGAVFQGPWTPSSLGDYAAGPNHVLPTNGAARFTSALGVRDFLKSTHVVRAEREGLERLAQHVIALADAEGLTAHADSVRLRLADAAAMASASTLADAGDAGVGSANMATAVSPVGTATRESSSSGGSQRTRTTGDAAAPR